MSDPIGGDLVTLDEAKLHLQIPATDLARDADVTAKLAQASATIRDYLKARNDPTWDTTTAPLPVKAATLYLVTAWSAGDRGDDTRTTDPAKTWEWIDLVLVRFRDPAFG